MRRAQTEILGFAMVMLLLSIGMLFVISFMVFNADSADIRRVYTDKSLAFNMNDAILASNSDCKNIRYQRLVVDCAEQKRILCEDGKRSCEFLQENLGTVLEMSLGEWEHDYRYRIYMHNERNSPLVDIYPDENTCKGSTEPSVLFFSTNTRSPVYAQLDICQ